MTDEEKSDVMLRINEKLAIAPLVEFGAESYFLSVLDALVDEIDRLRNYVRVLEARLPRTS